MIKWITISSFVLLTLLKPVSQFIWQVWYEVNQDFVAATLCENQEKPELECNGKCYLMKQLQKAEISPISDNEEQKRVINPFMLKMDLFSASRFFWEQEGISIENPAHDYSFQNGSVSEGNLSSIFHPPIS